uniref:RNA polymerase II nuclear localization protein SLC7A6OS n=1 Tax=Panagrellus redivivus TaxID=6233 RepID=A0A7E4UVJ4_PANRE
MPYVLNISPSGRVVSAAEKSANDNHRESPELVFWECSGDVKSVYAGESDEVRSMYAFEVVEHVSEMGKAFAKLSNEDEDYFDNLNFGDGFVNSEGTERKNNWHGFEWDMEVKKAEEMHLRGGLTETTIPEFTLPELTGDEVEEFLNKSVGDMQIRKNLLEQKSVAESETVADEKRSVYAFDMNAEDDVHSNADEDEESYYSDSDSSDDEKDDDVISEYAFDFYGPDGVESEYAFDYYGGKDSDAEKVIKPSSEPTNMNAESATEATSGCCFANCFLDNITWPDVKQCVCEKFSEYRVRQLMFLVLVCHLMHFLFMLPYYVKGLKTL